MVHHDGGLGLIAYLIIAVIIIIGCIVVVNNQK